MRFQRRPLQLLSVLALSGLAPALDFSLWAPPGPGDVRGPCPAMNSLANHAFIPHNGKNLTVALVTQVLGEVFNISPELGGIISFLGLLTAPNPNGGSFNLDDLDKHNVFEHDASLSRADFDLGGDDHTFNPEIFKKFISFFDGMDSVTIPVAAAARYSRVKDSRKHNPKFTYGVQQQITSYGETIKYFRTMVDPRTGQTPVAFVKILFEQQRLPFNEGWRPPTTQISGFSLASDILQLALATPEKQNIYHPGKGSAAAANDISDDSS